MNPRSFRFKVWLTWAGLLTLLIAACYAVHLDLTFVAGKLPYLLGLRLAPDGFFQGAALTLLVTACSMIFALLVALLTALGRLSRNALAFGVATFYASFFRGTPLLVQVLIVYLALPQVGVVLGGLVSGLIALSLNYGAYLAETIRSGLMGVPRGQREAASALGLSRITTASKVVAPQALRLIVPPAGALFVSMLKDSSLVSLMGLWELSFLAQSYARATSHYMEMLFAAALIYWAMSIGFELVQHRLETRFGRGVISRDAAVAYPKAF
ncbi:MAG: amino acid ABC transporter permease [Gammaproteobacteria bacterium]|nr:amino acid ABC transporter permease [Gammaproteobacteria bacterium]